MDTGLSMVQPTWSNRTPTSSTVSPASSSCSSAFAYVSSHTHLNSSVYLWQLEGVYSYLMTQMLSALMAKKVTSGSTQSAYSWHSSPLSFSWSMDCSSRLSPFSHSWHSSRSSFVPPSLSYWLICTTTMITSLLTRWWVALAFYTLTRPYMAWSASGSQLASSLWPAGSYASYFSHQ